MLANPLLNQGSAQLSGGRVAYGIVGPDDNFDSVYKKLRENCHRALTVQGLHFFCFRMAAALAGLGLYQIWTGKGKVGMGWARGQYV